MIWTYGGPIFLKRLAELDKDADVRVSAIIRSAVGLKAGMLFYSKQKTYPYTCDYFRFQAPCEVVETNNYRADCGNRRKRYVQQRLG